ncbi:MAG TPA: hypothetical protein VGG17_10020 [Acidimicrobiales bacterium]
MNALRTNGCSKRFALVAAVLLLLAPLIADRAASASSSTREYLPYLVTRAGTSDVIYTLWQREGCVTRSCLRLERSDNGGRTFTDVTPPPAAPIKVGMEGETPLIDEMTFVNASIGYAVEAPNNGRNWQSSHYFLTTNGAHSWRRVTISPRVYNFGVVVTNRYVYALTAECATKGPPCDHFALHRAPVGSGAWTRLTIPPTLLEPPFANLALAGYGLSVWLTAEDKSSPYPGVLATSRDEGRTFTVLLQQNLQSPGNCGLLPMSNSVIWANCWQGMGDDSVVYSHDGGENWQAQSTGPLVVGSVDAFDPITAQTAYFVNGSHPNVIDKIADEASRPTVVCSLPKDHYWSTLVFTNARDGVALTLNDGPNLQLWGTDNAGKQWRRIHV